MSDVIRGDEEEEVIEVVWQYDDGVVGKNMR